jgi:hypothetical protein
VKCTRLKGAYVIKLLNEWHYICLQTTLLNS